MGKGSGRGGGMRWGFGRVKGGLGFAFEDTREIGRWTRRGRMIPPEEVRTMNDDMIRSWLGTKPSLFVWAELGRGGLRPTVSFSLDSSIGIGNGVDALGLLVSPR